MKSWMRRTLISVLSLLVLAAVAVAALLWNGERKRERVVQLPALQSPAFVDDAAARERGAYLFASRGCADCHGADGAGRVFVDDGKGLKIKGPAIHSGPGSVTVDHGRYVANTCLGCHGPQLAGGPVPGGPPDRPPAARLNKGADSAMARYPNADALVAMFRGGKRADGSEVKVMPFGSFSKMSDTDLRALYLYLKSL